jgi:hypothetical protein
MDDQGNSLTYGTANRESSELHIKHGILKRINYPTGGFSEFEFEANKHSAIENVVSENQVFYTVAGYEYFNTNCQSTLTTPDKCFPLENIPLTNYQYRVGMYNTINNGSQTCSSTSNVKVQFFDPLTNIEVASINPSTSTTWLSLSSINGLLPNKIYKVKITGYNVTTCVFEINKVSTNTQLVTHNVGGLRIKQITNYDGISTNNNVVKTYEYLKDSSTASSGYLFALPKYGHYITNGDLSVKAFVWQSGSITPMANFQGYAIGYKRVVEKTLGNVGKTVYEYKIESDVNFPGEVYGSSKENFPVTPIRVFKQFKSFIYKYRFNIFGYSFYTVQ